jgi:hypothetical protein
MAQPSSTKYFLLWIFVAALWLVAAGLAFYRSGELNALEVVMALVFVVIAIVSRAKGRDAG